MAATALLKFSQATVGTGGNGQAFVGVLSQVVTITNASNTDVLSWQIDLVYSDASSSVAVATPYAFSDNGNTPTATFTPDVRRSFRWVLKVWSVTNRVGTPTDVDIRVFTVKELNGVIIPPVQIWPLPLPDPSLGLAGAKPNEMNFAGQSGGWAGSSVNDGLLNDTLSKLLHRSGTERWVDASTSVPSNKQNGSQGLPYQSIQQAMTDVQAGANDSSWTIRLAAGSYEGAVTVPSRRKIAIIGPDYATTRVNMTGGSPLALNVSGSCYLALKNVQVFAVTLEDGADVSPNTAVVYLSDASVSNLAGGATYTTEVIGVGPNTFTGYAVVTGRYAMDGVDHVSSVTCGTLAVYDTIFTSSGPITVTDGNALILGSQIDPGVEFFFSGYAQVLTIDSTTDYWVHTSGISLAGASVIVTDVGSTFPSKQISGSEYNFSITDAGKFLWTTNSGDIVVHMPLHTTVPFPIGTILYFQQQHFGRIILSAADVNVQLLSESGFTRTWKQYSTIWAIKVSENTWAVSGDTQGHTSRIPSLVYVDVNTTVLASAQDGSPEAPFSLIMPAHDALPVAGGTIVVVRGGATGENILFTKPINLVGQPLASAMASGYGQYGGSGSFTPFPSNVIVGNDEDYTFSSSSTLRLENISAPLDGGGQPGVITALSIAAYNSRGVFVASSGVLYMEGCVTAAGTASTCTGNLLAIGCVIRADLTVGGTVAEFKNCEWTTGSKTLTFSGSAGSMLVDATSDYYWNAATETLINGSKINTAVSPSLLQDALSSALPAQTYTQYKGAAILRDPSNSRNTIDLDRVDIREYGANMGGVQRTTATFTAGSPNGTLANAKNYINGNWLMLSGCGAAHGMATPGAPALAVQGTTGASTISVKIVAITSTGGYTAASAATNVTTANATLSETNFVEVWCANVPSAYRYLIYVQFGGSGSYTYMGGVIAHPQFGADGLAEPCTFRIKTSTPPTTPAWLPSTAPATGINNGLRTQILTGGGTTAITVFPVPVTSVTGANCDVCNLIPLEDSIDAAGDGYSSEVRVPRGTAYITGPLQLRVPVYISGSNGGVGVSGSIITFRDGCGLAAYNTYGADQWQPGTHYRLGDRVVSQLRTGVVGCWELTAVAASAQWGISGTTEPTWIYSGTTSDNGHTWTFRTSAGGYSAHGAQIHDLAFIGEGRTIPANRLVVDDDLRAGARALAGNGGTPSVWTVAFTPSLNSHYLPTTANATGKLYKATAVAGATAGTEPVWPKVHGATVVDGGVTWTCVDVWRHQGAGFLVATVITCESSQFRNFCGTGVLCDGNSYADGGAISRTQFRFVDIRDVTGHMCAVFGSDANGCTFEKLTLGPKLAGGGSCSIQDQGFYGSTFRNAIHDGGARFQNSPWTSSVQRLSVLDNCYTEGLSGSDTDWSSPGIVISGHHAYGFRTECLARLYAKGISINSAAPAQCLDTNTLEHDPAGDTFTRQLTGGLERKLFGTGTIAARTLLQEQHESSLAATGRSIVKVRGSGLGLRVEETAHFDARGVGKVFPHDLRVGSGLANEGRFGVLAAYPTKGVYSPADWYTWVLDNRRVALKPSRVGGIGYTARANSTAYAGPSAGVSGDIISTSSNLFVCVCGGTSAGSLPGAYATAAIGDYITDGTAIFQKWTTAQDPNITAVPNMWADAVAVSDAPATLSIVSGLAGQSCRDFAAASVPRTHTLSTTGVLGGDCFVLRQLNATTKQITVNTVDGGSVIFPENTRYMAVIKMVVAGTFTLLWAGPLDPEWSGTETLVAGVSAAIPANITANSVIVVTLKTPNTDAATVKYAALGADRINGTPGSFKISALTSAGSGAINTADVSTLDWRVIK